MSARARKADIKPAAKRLHARGCRGIVKAASAWRDLTFTEKLVWMNLAGQLARKD